MWYCAYYDPKTVETLTESSNPMEFWWSQNMNLAKTPYKPKCHANREWWCPRDPLGVLWAISTIPNVLDHLDFCHFSVMAWSVSCNGLLRNCLSPIILWKWRHHELAQLESYNRCLIDSTGKYQYSMHLARTKWPWQASKSRCPKTATLERSFCSW